jgi:hypothetical protein
MGMGLINPHSKNHYVTKLLHSENNHRTLMEEINAFNILVGKREVVRPLGRPRHRSENNIRMDLTASGYEGVDWIHLAQDNSSAPVP